MTNMMGKMVSLMCFVLLKDRKKKPQRGQKTSGTTCGPNVDSVATAKWVEFSELTGSLGLSSE